MPIAPQGLNLRRLDAPLPMFRGAIDSAQWAQAARDIAQAGGRLLALWGSDRRDDGVMVVCAAYAVERGLLWLELPLPMPASGYPDLATCFPCAERMQRALADMLGVRAQNPEDDRPWLDHGLWPHGFKPLAHGAGDVPAAATFTPAPYPFVRVAGDGVHEIAVGPVHAGIIEPGHFRFSVVGEKVLRLEQRLGYVHKGIERRFTELAPLDGYRLAGRVSGDSTVAYAWAYGMALESAAAATIPARAAWLRALLLERERVANHLGDLGALGNDAGLAVGLAQFSRLREDWQRLSRTLFGHRLMMDCVVPGGVAVDLDVQGVRLIAAQCDAIEAEVQAMHRLYDEHAGLQDRFIGTGRVTPALAAQLGLSGLAGRASGQAVDLRSQFPFAPYDALDVRIATHRNGDVAARVNLRFEEVLESLQLIRRIARELPAGAIRSTIELPQRPAFGAGWVEGWRGEILVALELVPHEGAVRIRRCHCHDPSWQNWPVLEHAMIGNIVPDFPLINKSFNLSYSGHDL
ncbi:MAG: Ni,Fe-hydrogenase III large subunit [Gammaproteobacteria bacterium HGW-Gammaproteobacteria-4]|jgi:Ni,Fe-hydrogenase III large subunit/Ni,Fe-hydrogenase III component G|nr:MAG: Ni,Fe-hydrogenase III large subunit [Gammaproteobacteria bacterium HGW-Gammaproteobacteria-4]